MGVVGSVFSLARAGYVLAREGVISSLPGDALPPPARVLHRMAGLVSRRRARDRKQSEKLSIALNRLGPSWVKLGQFLATRPDVVGKETARDLELLHDRIAPFGTAKAISQVEASLGRKAAEIFGEFDDAVAAASIAQVHKTKLKESGQQVAVKVIRPGIRERFRKDLDTFYMAARFQERFIEKARRLKPVSVVEMLEQSARIEMDMRLEAAAFSEMAENTKDDPGFRVPEVNWELSGRDVVTMEWVDGIKLTEVEALLDSGHDLNVLAANLVQSFLRHTLRDGFFHADMHPGNLFVDAEGTIVAVDLGIAGRLGRRERRFLAEILYGFITRNYRRVAEVHFEAGYVPAHHDVESFAQAIRAIGEPIHGQSAKTISMAKLLTLLFEVTEIFDMETRPELLLLQKTMVVVEGVARTLNPAFNMWQTAEPVVGDWIARNLGPARVAEDVREGLSAALRIMRALPEIAERAERMSLDMENIISNGMRLDSATIKAMGKAKARSNRLGHVALWALAAIIGGWLYFT